MNNNPQLPLGLTLREGARFDSYYAGLNLEAVRSVQAAAAGQGESLVYLAGAAGRGKTHLLQAACVAAAGCERSSAYLPLRQLRDFTPAVFDGLEQLDLLCIDDVTVVAGLDGWERGLFDLFNRVRQGGGTLLFAAVERPDRTGILLPDLVSRLGWGITYALKPLAEADMLAALDCRARARGLELPQETAQYLLKRYPRELSTLFALFDTLDTASLVEQRRLTVPFVRRVLDDSFQPNPE